MKYLNTYKIFENNITKEEIINTCENFLLPIKDDDIEAYINFNYNLNKNRLIRDESHGGVDYNLYVRKGHIKESDNIDLSIFILKNSRRISNNSYRDMKENSFVSDYYLDEISRLIYYLNDIGYKLESIQAKYPFGFKIFNSLEEFEKDKDKYTLSLFMKFEKNK